MNHFQGQYHYWLLEIKDPEKWYLQPIGICSKNETQIKSDTASDE